ncbi:MAG TPA: hypothetical protein PLQ35_11935 [bacterium]|nr:hypothetical protein [bacterium]HQL62995.1 hypothetical protein [bacterium]
MSSSDRNKGPDTQYYTRESQSRYSPSGKNPQAAAVTESNRFVCRHCGIPFAVIRNARKLQLLREGIIKRPLCAPCQERDRELLTAVNQCLRVLGGACTVAEVVGIYSDETLARSLFKDPFVKVRARYNGKETLTVQDIEGWIEEGVIQFDEHGQIKPKPKGFLHDLELRQQVREAREEMIDKQKPKDTFPDEGGTVFVSRRSKKGGASIGAEYWETLKDAESVK